MLSISCKKKEAATIPVVTTSDISDITQHTGTSGGTITSDGGAEVTVRGVCWSTTATPTVLNTKTSDSDNGSGSFTSSLTGLTAGTTYYLRAYAINIIGAGYGTAVSFTTSPGSTAITDYDGNVYTSIVIGTQEWMVENLETTHLNDGTAIPNVNVDTVWAALTTPGYCWYNKDVTNKDIYGGYYNWYTVNTGKLCPAGWHVSSNDDWTTLMTFLGGTSVAAQHLKEAGTTHWTDPNTGDNTSGFTALGAGSRTAAGPWLNFGDLGYWWNSDSVDDVNAMFKTMHHAYNNVGIYTGDKRTGFSIRCIKN